MTRVRYLPWTSSHLYGHVSPPSDQSVGVSFLVLRANGMRTSAEIGKHLTTVEKTCIAKTHWHVAATLWEGCVSTCGGSLRPKSGTGWVRRIATANHRGQRAAVGLPMSQILADAMQNRVSRNHQCVFAARYTIRCNRGHRIVNDVAIHGAQFRGHLAWHKTMIIATYQTTGPPGSVHVPRIVAGAF